MTVQSNAMPPPLRVAALGLAVWGASLAQAGDKKVVVELFSSQGCSSCPPADRLLHKLADKDNLIVLSLHVDYWDYIGWKDAFADPAHTVRQKAYARVSGRRMIYTPQMIINGQDDVVGARAMELTDAIAAHMAKPQRASIAVVREGTDLKIGLVALDPDLTGDFEVHLVRYRPEETVDVRRGENAGRELTYVHVVDAWETIAEWNAKAPTTVSAAAAGSRPAVILVQRPGPGDIVAAAEVR